MMKINKLLLLMFIFVSFIYGCEESESPALSDPNTISRNDTPYYIQVEKQEGDNTNTAFTFQVSKSGNALIDDKLYSVKWSLGDNTEKEGLKVEHQYADKGEYTVRAYITDITEDSLRSEEITVTAGVDPDIYNTKITAYKQEDRREYSFIASGVSSSGQELKYSWNFGDGTPATVAKKENSATHQFPKYGAPYTATLTVDNGLGGADSKIKTTIDIKTDLPDLSLECGSGGVRLSDDNTEVLGQTLECRPVLTGGMVPDALYNWNFYEEISKAEYNKMSADNQTGWELVADEVDYSEQVYRKIAGSSQSIGSSTTHFEFKDGGRKFVEATGSSQSFLTDNIEDNLTVNMPYNAILGLVTCKKANEGDPGTEDFQPASGLVWRCEALGYAMPKFDNGTKYIAPLTDYKWSIKKHNGENQEDIIFVPLGGNYMDYNQNYAVLPADGIQIKHEVRCYTSTNSSDWTQETGKGHVIHEGSDNLTKYDYSACKTFITYAAPKFDVDNENGETYTQAVLDVKYTGNVIAGADGEYTQTDINLSQSTSFKIAAPVLGEITIQDDVNNPLRKTFTTAGLKLEGASNNIELSGVTYHWDFGDGTIGTSQDTNGAITHTYANADGQYDVTVYASHDKFDRTNESTKRFTMLPEFLNSTFTVTQAANKPNTNNLWNFKTNIFAVVDCKPVDTNYQLIISGNGYTKTYNMGTLTAENIKNKVTLNNGEGGCTATIKNGADNVTNVTSAGITTANKNNNSILSIPLSTAFNVELVVTSPATEGEMRQSTVIPLPDLQDINVVHPSEINLENSFRWDYVRYSVSGTVIQNMNLADAKCIYDFNIDNINDNLNGKWGYFVGANKPGNKGGYTTITAGNSTVEVTCNQKVWVAQWTGQAINDVNNKVKVYTAVVQEKSPAITSNPFARFLDILLENESY